MCEPTLQAQMDAANSYEALFVPALFVQWASKVADVAQIQPDFAQNHWAREVYKHLGYGEDIIEYV